LEEIRRAWTADESLADLSLQFDWDYFASMVAALRVYAFEHGTAPVWNFPICAGRPELAIPSSWAYTWPSVFAYLFHPNAAIVALWIALTAAGIAATYCLLSRWTADRIGAATGACLYACSGYFAVRFHLGHVSFAFFHLVPVLLLAWERALAHPVREGGLRATLALGAVSFLFFSAGLPHGLIYFYPALLLLIAIHAVRAWRHNAVATLVPPLVAHVLGLWLASYKLWPVVRWQLEFPRVGVLPESYAPWTVIADTLRFVPRYLGAPPVPLGPRNYPAMEYNAFVGPVPWLLAGVAVVAWLGRRSSRPLEPGFGIALVAIGIALALGNENPWGPGYLFIDLPVLSGVRAFARYQILVVFGLAVLVAFGIDPLARRARATIGAGAGLALRLALAAAVCIPVLAQSRALVWNVHATPDREILSEYGLEPGATPTTPSLVGIRFPGGGMPMHAKAVVESGHWVANCREDIALAERVRLPVHTLAAVSRPAPRRVSLAARSLALEFDPDVGRITPRLQSLPDLRFGAPLHRTDTATWIDGTGLDGEPLRIVAHYPGPGAGAWASAIGALAAGLLALLAWRRHGDRQGDLQGDR
jgi:hypothetical protein